MMHSGTWVRDKEGHNTRALSQIRYVLVASAVLEMLVGCNGAGSQIAPLGAEPQSVLASGSRMQLGDNPAEGRLSRSAPAAFPGKNGRIAFLYGIAGDGGGDVYTMNPDGTHVLRLTHFGPVFKRAAIWDGWSPNGRQIVFSVTPTTSLAGRLWIMSADGRHKRRIFEDPGFNDTFPSFSPDGKRIIFMRQDLNGDFVLAIYRVNVNGSELTAITHFNIISEDLRPEYSPDGAKIEFETAGRGGFGRVIALCNPNGSDIRLITPPQSGAWGADWSPDGRRLALSTYWHQELFGENEEIWSFNVDDQRMTQLTKNNFPGQESYYAEPHDEFPSWSPDGTAIVFERQSRDLSSSGLFIITNRGGEWREKPLHPQGLSYLSGGLSSSPLDFGAPKGYLSARSGLGRIDKNGEVPKWGTAPNIGE